MARHPVVLQDTAANARLVLACWTRLEGSEIYISTPGENSPLENNATCTILSGTDMLDIGSGLSDLSDFFASLFAINGHGRQ